MVDSSQSEDGCFICLLVAAKLRPFCTVYQDSVLDSLLLARAIFWFSPVFHSLLGNPSIFELLLGHPFLQQVRIRSLASHLLSLHVAILHALEEGIALALDRGECRGGELLLHGLLDVCLRFLDLAPVPLEWIHGRNLGYLRLKLIHLAGFEREASD